MSAPAEVQSQQPQEPQIEGAPQPGAAPAAPSSTPAGEPGAAAPGASASDDEKEAKTGTSIAMTVTAEYDAVHFNKQHDSFVHMTSLEAPYFRPETRAPIDLFCVLDVSGSMSGERIKLMVETCEFVVKNMESTDRLGIVVYESAVKLVLDLTAMDQPGKDRATAQLKKLKADGCTNLAGGLCMAVDRMRERQNANDVASVMLFTDGQANVGYTSVQDIVKAFSNPVYSRGAISGNTEPLRNPNKVPLKCTINTFGFGENHNADLLKAIAEAGRGMYCFIENTGQIAETFADCLGGLVSTVGNKLVLTLEALNGVEITRVLAGQYKHRVQNPRTVIDVELDDIQSEESRDVLLHVTLPVLPQAAPGWPCVRSTLRYENVLLSKQETVTAECKVDRIDVQELGERNLLIDKQCNRVLVTDAMQMADRLAGDGELKRARDEIQKAKTTILASRSAEDTYCQALCLDLDQAAAGLQSRQQYQQVGRKNLHMNALSHGKQRAVKSTNWASQRAYMNKSKSAMRSRFKK